MIVESPETGNCQEETTSNDQHPLLISENPSPYSDSETLFDQLDTSNDEPNINKNDLEKNDCSLTSDNIEQNSIRPNTLILPKESYDSEQTKEQNTNENFSSDQNIPDKENCKKNGDIEMKNNLCSGNYSP